jgi:hypothetical protein
MGNAGLRKSGRWWLGFEVLGVDTVVDCGACRWVNLVGFLEVIVGLVLRLSGDGFWVFAWWWG